MAFSEFLFCRMERTLLLSNIDRMFSIVDLYVFNHTYRRIAIQPYISSFEWAFVWKAWRRHSVLPFLLMYFSMPLQFTSRFGTQFHHVSHGKWKNLAFLLRPSYLHINMKTNKSFIGVYYFNTKQSPFVYFTFLLQTVNSQRKKHCKFPPICFSFK